MHAQANNVATTDMKAIENEKKLFAAIEQGETEALQAFETIGGREGLEFSCRCYSAAISKGMVALSLAFAKAGFVLSVADEPFMKASLAAANAKPAAAKPAKTQPAAAGSITTKPADAKPADAKPAAAKPACARGLKTFMEQYRYCKAKRTYYLPIALCTFSAKPLEALMQAKLLPEHDASEILTLALRHGNINLARTLVAQGATLPNSIRGSIPENLKGKSAIYDNDSGNRWRSFVSPCYTLEVIELALEHAGSSPCSVLASWMLSYKREPNFAQKLATIVLRSNASHCENAPDVLCVLAEAGQTAAVEYMTSWSTIDANNLAHAYEAAQQAGQVETAALLIRARKAHTSKLSPLSACSLEEKAAQ